MEYFTLFDLEKSGMSRFYLGQNPLKAQDILSKFFQGADLGSGAGQTIVYKIKSPTTTTPEPIGFDPPSFFDTRPEPEVIYLPPIILGEGIKAGLFA